MPREKVTAIQFNDTVRSFDEIKEKMIRLVQCFDKWIKKEPDKVKFY